jgi:hypothetical protein
VKRIYVAGPMTGLPELNFPAFRAEAARLRAEGWEVISPVEINHGLEHEGWNACMRRDLAALATCDAIQMLPGWHASKGATLEHHVATQLGLAVYPQDGRHA